MLLAEILAVLIEDADVPRRADRMAIVDQARAMTTEGKAFLATRGPGMA